ncbi:hypothetical protein AJ78_04207 [Emergomyces pasteurianus Ep9510]|uniref:C6 finger domain transcription factor nscR n=1 Tax=Emergomyces pasteurianus Ep9510 TaxID=1447872 RepID=A0A1J9PHR0_9EURO|nr:hypothetical protein AJ78_04207 [Emergomyces pasteurianus Ep9510]
MPQERKRRIQACYPCYTRKQKCNRQYPCNHCSHRRRAEECVYSSPAADGSYRRLVTSVRESQSQVVLPQGEDHSGNTPTIYEREGHRLPSQHTALARSFGYFEDSNSNTMALLRNLELPGEDETDLMDDSSLSISDTVQHELGRMPERQILDFLVQYFVNELNWMKQVVHAPSFLSHYQQWWIKRDSSMAVSDIEFATLIVRICSYATQFLPSPSHNIDQIRGRSLSDIRDTCTDIGNNLSKTCETFDKKGSLFRVQHLLFAALKRSCEGGTAQFWEGIASAARAAQKAGIHTEPIQSGESPISEKDSAQALEKEVRRRTFCSLYVLDSHLSRQLDRVPFLPDDLVMETIPRLHVITDIGSMPPNLDADVPDIFTERLMEVQLGRFWRSFKVKQNSKYDPTEAEQRYEKLCAEYLPSLHAAFDVDHPDTTWDKALPKLPMQRQLLHISIFDSICWNFRPLLLLNPSQIASLPPYKRVLLQSQKLRLGLAAFRELEAVTALHSMFGGSYTRFAAIIFNTFEATVLLLCLCTHPDFPFDQGDENIDILGVRLKLTYTKVMQVAEQAIHRLQMLAELSDMAASGARVAAQLFAKAVKNNQSPNPVTPAVSNAGSSWPTVDSITMEAIDDVQVQWQSLEQADPALMATVQDSFPNFQLSSLDIPMLWGSSGL